MTALTLGNNTYGIYAVTKKNVKQFKTILCYILNSISNKVLHTSGIFSTSFTQEATLKICK